MKTRLLLLVLLFTGTALFGQNLVINPSFENTSSNCGNFGGEGFGTDLLDWDNANSNAPGDSCSSPDLFSACNTIFGTPSPTNMPNSLLGFQRSRTGTRHAGIITYAPGIALGCNAVGADNYREYIQGHTTAPLVAGQTYCVSMYVSCADNVVWATNNIGVRFTNTQYLRDACANGNNSLINLPPQLNYSCAAITDTSNANWVRIQWDYVATGGERYFTIGNFFNNANTTVACSNSGANINPYAYYYIDDVSIVANTCCAATIAQVNNKCITDTPFNLTAIAPLGTNCNPTVSGTWSGPGITNASLGTFNPATAGVGTHTITYTLSCGQTVTTTIIVNNCAALTICQEPNGNLTVTGGTGPYQWQSQSTVQDCSGCPFGQCFPPICNGVSTTIWTTFTTGATATPPGTFPFRVIDAGAGSTTITTLTGIPACQCVLALSTSSVAASCGQANGSATVNVTTGTGPYTYAWSNGGNGQTISGVVGGTYSVTVTGGGCSTTTTVNVNTTAAVTASTTPTATTCGLANGSATVTPDGGNGTYTYSWTNGGGSGSSISNVAAGTYTVTVTSGGCSTTSTVTIPPSNPITLGVTSNNTTCGLANGSAQITPSGGSGNYTYSWTNGGGSSSSLTNVAAGTYTVTVTGGVGCTATSTVVIAPSTAITLTPASTNANCNQANGTASISAAGGNGNYTYLWSNGGQSNSISGVVTGNYTVTVTDGQNCTATLSVAVGQNTSMTSTVSGTGTICSSPNSGTVNLTVNGGVPGYSYLWSNNDTTQDLTGVAAGTYTVTITDDAGCIITNTYEVAAPELPVATIVSTDESCKGLGDGELNLTVTGGTGPYTTVWNTGAVTEDLVDLGADTYTVTVTDANGCVVTQTGTVVQGPDFPITITQSNGVLTASTAPNYQWYKDGVVIPNATSQTYTPTQPGTYFVTTSVGACKYASNLITIVSVTEATNFAKVDVFPNPATDNITVKVDLLSPQTVVLNLVDVLGRRIMQTTNGNKASTYQFNISVKDLSPGMYFLNINTDNETKSVKVIVGQ
jgi:hypothetical protein